MKNRRKIFLLAVILTGCGTTAPDAFLPTEFHLESNDTVNTHFKCIDLKEARVIERNDSLDFIIRVESIPGEWFFNNPKVHKGHDEFHIEFSFPDTLSNWPHTLSFEVGFNNFELTERKWDTTTFCNFLKTACKRSLFTLIKRDTEWEKHIIVSEKSNIWTANNEIHMTVPTSNLNDSLKKFFWGGWAITTHFNKPDSNCVVTYYEDHLTNRAQFFPYLRRGKLAGDCQ